jgi:parallel beta-helix repeat protein
MVDAFAAWDASTNAIINLTEWNGLLATGLMKPLAYIVRKTGSYYEAINGATGAVDYGGDTDEGGTSGVAAHSVATAAITAAAGGHVHIKGADYSLTDEIVVGQSGTLITMDGLDTKLTQTVANKAIFSITTKTNVRISNGYLYGTGAGTGSGIYATTTCTDLTIDHMICENWGYHGIHVINSDYALLFANKSVSNIRSGVLLDTVDYSRVLGNKILTNTRHGLEMDDCNYNLVSQNHIIGNDSGNLATYDGVNMSRSAGDCDFNRIVNNVLDNNDRYEINVVGANCVSNTIKENTFNPSGDHEQIINDVGTTTIFKVHPLSFVAGGDVDGTPRWNEFIPTTASAKGWQVNDAADFATALGQLPLDLSEIVKIKIWAVALGAPINAGGQMHLDINMNAGASNLAYTTEAVALTSFDGEEADYVANDAVSWYVEIGDDADIGSMVGGMTFEQADSLLRHLLYCGQRYNGRRRHKCYYEVDVQQPLWYSVA